MVFLENTSSFKSQEPVNWILICEKCRSVVSNFFATPWTVVCQAPLSMEFSRQEYWSGQPFPSPGDLPDPGIEPMSSTLQADSLLSVPPGKPIHEMGPCRSNYLQMWSSQIIQVGPKSMISILVRDLRREGPVRLEWQSLEWCGWKPRKTRT